MNKEALTEPASNGQAGSHSREPSEMDGLADAAQSVMADINVSAEITGSRVIPGAVRAHVEYLIKVNLSSKGPNDSQYQWTVARRYKMFKTMTEQVCVLIRMHVWVTIRFVDLLTRVSVHCVVHRVCRW